MGRWTIAALVPGLVSIQALGQVTYEEVAQLRGIGTYDAGPGYGAGISGADFDDDGDVDLFVARPAGTPNQVYRNLGNGHFEEVAATLGLDSTLESRAGLWVDLDGDGRLDLVVAGDCFDGGGTPCYDRMLLRVHRQTKTGGFDDVTTAMGLTDDGVTTLGQHRSGIVAGDLNGDGWLDLVTGLWQGPATVLFNDEGQGLIDVSAASGIESESYHHWQPSIFDFDGDGWSDIYWATDFTDNLLWINQGDGTFTDVAPGLGLNNAMNDMGQVLADYDNDRDLDIFVTEIFENGKHNILYRNDTVDGVLAFSEVATDSGVADCGFAWGATFYDADNDGWLDLAVTNGWFAGIGFADTSRFFHNPGGEQIVFEDRSAAVGFDDAFFGSSLIAFDMNRDGVLDLAQTCNNGGPLRLLEGTPQPAAVGNGYLVVKPRAGAPNTHGIGAVVRVQLAGGMTMTRLITAGTSHLGQEPAEAFFGLGDAKQAARVVIAWPDGARTILDDVAANQTITVERGPCAGTADLNGDGHIGFADLSALINGWGPCATLCPEDVDRNGSVGFADLVELLQRWGPCV